MRLPAALARQLVAHAAAEFPNECCGMIAGREGAALRVLRATNVASMDGTPSQSGAGKGSPFMYVIDPREQMRMMDEIDDAGEDLLAIYHSHTRSAAYPSRTDVELAFYPDTLYLIVSLQDRDAPDIRAFHLYRDAPEGEQIVEEPVEAT